MQNATARIALIAGLLIAVAPRARTRAEFMLNSNVKLSLKLQSLLHKKKQRCAHFVGVRYSRLVCTFVVNSLSKRDAVFTCF